MSNNFLLDRDMEGHIIIGPSVIAQKRRKAAVNALLHDSDGRVIISSRGLNLSPIWYRRSK